MDANVGQSISTSFLAEMEILTNKQISVFLWSLWSWGWGKKIPKKSELGKVLFYALFKMAAKIWINMPITLLILVLEPLLVLFMDRKPCIRIQKMLLHLTLRSFQGQIDQNYPYSTNYCVIQVLRFTNFKACPQKYSYIK